MNIKIMKSELESRVSTKTGKPYQMQCLLIDHDGEQRKIEIFHNDKSQVYKAGLYKISDSSFQIENKNLVLKWLTFEPVMQQQTRATA